MMINAKFHWPVLFFLALIVLSHLVGYNGLYGQDAHAYYHFSQKMQLAIWQNGQVTDFFWPVFYPTLGGLLSFTPELTMKLLQWISIGALAGCIFFVKRLLDESYRQKQTINLYLLISLGLSPTLLLYSLNIMADLLTAFFIVGTFFFTQQFERRNKDSFFLGATSCALAAFFTRYAAAVVVFTPCLWLIVLLFQRKKWLLLFKASLVVVITALPHFIIKGFDSPAISHHWLESWSLANLFRSEFQTVDGLHTFPRPNIAFVLQHAFHPRFLFFGGLLFLFIRKSDFKSTFQKLLFISILLYACFLGGITYQSNRYLLLSSPLIVLFLYPAFARFIERLAHQKAWFPQLFWLGALVGQVFLFGYYFKPYYLRNQLEQEVAMTLEQYPAQTLYSFGMEAALESYQIKQEIKSLWETKYTVVEPHALVLFNLQANQVQWAGKNPMMNWMFIHKNYHLKKIKSWDDGWELFEVTASK